MKKIITLDQNLKEELFFNKELRQYFVQNLKEIIENSDYYDESIIEDLCHYTEIRKAIFENLDLVFSKMKRVGAFALYMEEEEIEENIELFFKYDISSGIGALFNNAGSCDSQLLLKLLAKNVQKIYDIMGFWGVYNLIRMIPDFINFKEDNEAIKGLDIFFANNIDKIDKEIFPCMTFDFKYFMNMNEFKKEIKKKGADFFVGFPLNYDISIEECKEIAESVFGEFTTENFTKMKFGQNNEKQALIYQTLIDELLKHSGNKKIEDIEQIGKGFFSVAYRVGDFVLKFRKSTNNDTIPNHWRILQSIVKTKIEDVEDSFLNRNIYASCIEVQNLVDSKWLENKSFEEIDDILFQIYSDLRDDGLFWVDIKPGNVGKLLKTNTSNILYVDIDKKKKQIIPHEDGNGLVGKVDRKPLEAGEYVIIDNEFIVKEEDLEALFACFPNLRKRMDRFEQRYLREKRSKEKIEINITH